MKLVTDRRPGGAGKSRILIHTSVKLVTVRVQGFICSLYDFNPHEREARDMVFVLSEAGKNILIHTSVKLVTF